MSARESSLRRFNEKGKARNMRKRLELALMLTTAIATSISLASTPVFAAAADDDKRPAARSGITTTEENGRTVYVNEDDPKPVRQAQAAEPKRPGLVYWSSKENR